MKNTQQIQSEAKQLVYEFKKTEERGEFRNKWGRIWWPVWHYFIVPGASLCGILSGNIAGIILGTALFGISHPLTKGFSINVQNIAIKNAGILGRFLKNKHVSYDVRRRAIVEYLNQSGALFYNKKWMKNHVSDIDKMAEGQRGKTIPNLVASLEYNITRVANSKEKKKEKFSLKERLKIYQRTLVEKGDLER